MSVLCRRLVRNLKSYSFPSSQDICTKRPPKSKLKTVAAVGGATGVALLITSSLTTLDLPYVGGVLRFVRSLRIALTVSIDYTFSSIGLSETDQNYRMMMSRIHQRAADRLLKGCLDNGGTYIKLGQGLVSMNHVLPEEYTETLRKLQDKCLSRSTDEVKKLFMEDFGKSPEELYSHFDENAVAAASLAQVFKATTKDGKEVAVKVQYKDLQSRFISDVATIQFLLNIIGRVHPDFNFAWILDDLKSSLAQELDFQNEGKNAEKCAKDLQPLKYIYVPKVYWDLSSKRVLVTEFISGYKIDDTHRLLKEGFSLADIDHKMFEAFGYQIFSTGFVHADPHPGNIMVRRYKNKAQLVLLDHGLYEILSDSDRKALSHMWKAIVLNDFKNMQKYSRELGVEDYEMFAEILTQTPLKMQNFHLVVHLTEEDLAFIKEFAKNKFDKVMRVLKDMPSTLLLILRNLNTIRAIAHEHGDPIDRYQVLARTATSTAYTSYTGLLNLPSILYFELMLLTNKFRRWWNSVLLRIIHMFVATPDIDNVISDMQRMRM